MKCVGLVKKPKKHDDYQFCEQLKVSKKAKSLDEICIKQV